MNNSVFVFDHLTRTIARLSLLAIFVSFSAYTIAYIMLIIRHEIPKWTSVAAFQEGKGQTWFRLLTFCQVMAFLTPLCFVGFVASLDASATSHYRAVTQIALSAATAFAVLSSVHYFVQLALARTDLTGEHGAGLEHLFQLNPGALITAVNILGWTLFFAIACLCLAPLFHGSAGARVLGALLATNGIVCLLGMVGYLWQVRVLSAVFFNVMGLAVLGFSLLGCFML